jgi:hypothetical protein
MDEGAVDVRLMKKLSITDAKDRRRVARDWGWLSTGSRRKGR